MYDAKYPNRLRLNAVKNYVALHNPPSDPWKEVVSWLPLVRVDRQLSHRVHESGTIDHPLMPAPPFLGVLQDVPKICPRLGSDL